MATSLLKRSRVPWRVLPLAALLLALPVALSAQGTATPAPGLGPGVTYLTEQNGAAPWAVFVVKIERARPELQLVSSLARGTVFGLATVPQQVVSLPARRGTPVAAVNGDWFQLPAGPYQGDLVNLFVHRGELVSTPAWGDTFWLDPQGQPHLQRVTTELAVAWPDGTRTPLGLNEARKDDGAVLYTPTLGPSTHTTGGRELVLERSGAGPWLPLRLGREVSAQVREVHESGDTPLSLGTMVLSLGPKLAAALPPVAAGAVLNLSATSSPDLSGVELALGGGPILLRDGQVPDFGTGEQPRHPRTALGWNDTHLFLMVVDGRRAGWSVGMTIPELAALTQRLGCTWALNLDGGGSSTLWLTGDVRNRPSDGQPRSVANALLVVRQSAP